MLTHATKPVIGFAAYSGTGKTTLLEKLIPLLNAKGVRVSLIKHAHHNFDIDQRGKDSYRLRKAGAIETLVASGKRWALIHEEALEKRDPDLEYLLSRLDQRIVDLILVEGFKHIPFTRIELHRSAMNKPFLYPDDPDIVALASDVPIQPTRPITCLDINSTEQIAAFIIRYINQRHSEGTIK